MKQSKRVEVLGVICAATVAGCSSLFGPSGPKISVSLVLQRAPDAPTMLRADIDGRRVQLPSHEAGDRRSTDVRGLRYGPAQVRVALVTGAGDSLAAVEFSQQFQRGHTHWVAALVGEHRPAGHCIGSVAVAPLRAGSTDSLFVMYGSLPEDAIC